MMSVSVTMVGEPLLTVTVTAGALPLAQTVDGAGVTVAVTVLKTTSVVVRAGIVVTIVDVTVKVVSV